MDCSPPSSSVHGISQARILEWVAISFSRGSSWPKSQTHISCIAGRFFTAELQGKPKYIYSNTVNYMYIYQHYQLNTYTATLSFPEFFEITGCDMISSMHDFMHFFFLFGWIYLHVEPPSGFIFCLTCQHLHGFSDLPHPSSRKPPLDTITFSPEPLNSTFSCMYSYLLTWIYS